VKRLLNQGLESVHVGELGMASASDVEILDLAGRNDYIIVTLDADFHTLLAMRQSQAPTVIRIRIEGLKGQDLAQLLKRVIAHTKEDILVGSALSITEKGIRVRRLPFH
jgi:predicted nuclease of predicted toxin-antitoxin system